MATLAPREAEPAAVTSPPAPPPMAMMSYWSCLGQRESYLSIGVNPVDWSDLVIQVTVLFIEDHLGKTVGVLLNEIRFAF